MPDNNEIAAAIRYAFVSPNVPDSNLEPANLVDTSDRIASALFKLAKSVEGQTEEVRRVNENLRELISAIDYK